jgi:hypothetical protein
MAFSLAIAGLLSFSYYFHGRFSLVYLMFSLMVDLVEMLSRVFLSRSLLLFTFLRLRERK